MIGKKMHSFRLQILSREYNCIQRRTELIAATLTTNHTKAVTHFTSCSAALKTHSVGFFLKSILVYNIIYNIRLNFKILSF